MAAPAPATGGLADWGLAARTAWLIARTAARPSITRAELAALRADLGEVAARADGLARAATGLGADLPPATCHVIGRRQWIRTNLATIAHLTDPVAESLLERAGVARPVARRALGLQLGVVFGYLASRVLGQYEVFLPDGQAPGRLLLVGPNLLETERGPVAEGGLSPEEFRLGVCLHEIAHRLQFESVTWLRPHLRGIVDRYLEQTRLDPARMRAAVTRLGELARSDPRRLTDPQVLIEVVLTPEQAELVHQAQSLMSVLEGHGNLVMDWGAERAAAEGAHAPDPSRVRQVLERRRSRPVDEAMRRALGLSMKAEQYRVGERFLQQVAEEHGREAVNRLWDDPANTPSPEELTEPRRWAERVLGS